MTQNTGLYIPADHPRAYCNSSCLSGSSCFQFIPQRNENQFEGTTSPHSVSIKHEMKIKNLLDVYRLAATKHLANVITSGEISWFQNSFSGLGTDRHDGMPVCVCTRWHRKCASTCKQAEQFLFNPLKKVREGFQTTIAVIFLSGNIQVGALQSSPRRLSTTLLNFQASTRNYFNVFGHFWSFIQYGHVRDRKLIFVYSCSLAHVYI